MSMEYIMPLLFLLTLKINRLIIRNLGKQLKMIIFVIRSAVYISIFVNTKNEHDFNQKKKTG